MDEYSIKTDFENYIKENDEIITNIQNNSLLDDFVSPIIKTLTFLGTQDDVKDKEEIMSFGLQLLFENLEQIKLYLQEFNNDFEILKEKSLYIKLVFNLEEMRIEIEKLKDSNTKDDLSKIETALDFFEDCIGVKEPNQEELDKQINFYYDLLKKYPDVVLMTDIFEEYCAAYGI